MAYILLVTFAAIAQCVVAGLQFEMFPKPPEIVPAAIPVSIPNSPADLSTEALDYTKKIQDLVELVRTTLVDMGEIAVEDNPAVGAKIVEKLQVEIAKAVKIFSDYTTNALRNKREAKSGDTAYNKVGDVLVNSNDAIEPEKKGLSPAANKRINKKHRDGVKKCGADSCKAAAKTLEEADDESERQ